MALDRLRKGVARTLRRIGLRAAPVPSAPEPAPNPPTFSFEVNWIGGEAVVPLQFCATNAGERILESGAAAVEQQNQVGSYLTQVPAAVSRRPATSVPIPTSEIELVLSVSAAGLDVSFWILEFHGEHPVAKTSWRIDRDLVVPWRPHPDCDAIRFAWWVKGIGTLNTARVHLREPADTDRLMATWRALNAPKSALGSVLPANECPAYLGPDPEVLTQATAASHPFFQSTGIDPSKLVLDGGALVGEIDRGVWPFLQEAITDRSYRWTCPFTGASIRSTDTLIAAEPTNYLYVFVRFESAGHVFFLILCPFRSSRVGVYFPDAEVVVSRLKLGPLVRGFRSLAVRHADRFVRYLTTSEPRKTTVPINTLGHWGHVVLNEVDALQWLFDSGNDKHIDRWLKGEVGFFQFNQLFPEIPATKVREASSPQERFLACLEDNALVINPQIASYYLGEKAGTRLVEFWRRQGEANGTAANIAAKLAGRFPVIWCEIRANDRLWTNQLDGLKAIVAKLQPHYPNMALALAGWSRMLKHSASDEKMIALESKVLDTITEALAGTTCVPVLGLPTGEKMLWALNSHLHISIVGSGLLFALLAKLPGVTLVSRYYQENELFLGDDERRVDFMYGVDHLAVLPTKFVQDDTRIENGEIRNFTVDPDALADFVHAELTRAEQRSPGQPRTHA